MRNILATIAFLCTFTAAAEASLITSIDPNDTFTQAQDIHTLFSQGNYDKVEHAGDSAWEWVSIEENGKTYRNIDIFTFSVFAGQTYVFDIDGANFNSAISLFDDTGALLTKVNACLWQNTNFVSCNYNTIDNGSTSWLDPMLQWTFSQSGDYFVSVTNAYGVKRLRKNAEYELQITRSKPGSMLPPGGTVDVPAPATLGLMTLALVPLLRRNKNK